MGRRPRVGGAAAHLSGLVGSGPACSGPYTSGNRAALATAARPQGHPHPRVRTARLGDQRPAPPRPPFSHPEYGSRGASRDFDGSKTRRGAFAGSTEGAFQAAEGGGAGTVGCLHVGSVREEAPWRTVRLQQVAAPPSRSPGSPRARGTEDPAQAGWGCGPRIRGLREQAWWELGWRPRRVRSCHPPGSSVHTCGDPPPTPRLGCGCLIGGAAGLGCWGAWTREPLSGLAMSLLQGPAGPATSGHPLDGSLGTRTRLPAHTSVLCSAQQTRSEHC